MDSLGEVKVFSRLDANSSYWKIEIGPEDREMISLKTDFGTYVFTRKPFGLKNSLASYQRAIDLILITVKWQFAFEYLNYIIV